MKVSNWQDFKLSKSLSIRPFKNFKAIFEFESFQKVFLESRIPQFDSLNLVVFKQKNREVHNVNNANLPNLNRALTQRL